MNKRHFLGAALFLGLALSEFGQTLPRPAGAWSAKTLDGSTLTLQPYKGKNVVLAFLLTT
jgi:hypothetical protein